MNSSTSWPNSSRKYSASVRPVSPTRARAPGGSFIWPKTSAVLSMTPDSFISSHRLLPSRVRSPTPANTLKPPCSWAMLRISSITMTVLPTPAPPNRPILLPLAKVVTRSMTLIPVSSTFVSTACSLTGGASRWMGRWASDLIGPFPSIGAPITLIIRPRVDLPTGTVIGAPVSFTSVPRIRPSVLAMAMVRTEFFGDRGLPHVVPQQGQVGDQLAGVVGRVTHGNHLRGVKAGQVIEHRRINLRFNIPREETSQYLLGFWFVQVVDAHPFFPFGHLDRDQDRDGGHQLGHRDKVGMHQGHLSNALLDVLIAGNRDRGEDIFQLGPVAGLRHIGDDRHTESPKVVAPLAADRHEHGVGPLSDV